MSLRSKRLPAKAVLLALLVLLAGCSTFGGSGPETPTPTEQPTTVDEATTAESETDEETTDEEATDEETTVGNATSSDERESTLSGRLLVDIDGRDTHLDSGPNASFWFNESDEHTWHAEEPMTLAEALESTGVEASADSLSYEGETYRESDENTSISYRVAGTVIDDPTEYELEDLESHHEIVVQVDTGTRETPGRYVEQSHPHPHGTLNVTVEGEPVDFTQEKYVLSNEQFHFHGDENATRWHGHSLNLTASYAVSTFPGMNMTSNSLTYDGTTYRANDSETSFNVTVNGESVDPSTYVMNDGDDIQVTVDRTE